MDHTERSVRYLFWRQLIISVIAVILAYILFIRPIQSTLVNSVILPFFHSFLEPGSHLIAVPGKDEFFISSSEGRFNRVAIEVPFNGYFWLAMSMIWPTKNTRFKKIIFNYNWALFIIIPLFAFGLLNEYAFLAPLANVHEKVYKALFLILGILSVGEADRMLKG